MDRARTVLLGMGIVMGLTLVIMCTAVAHAQSPPAAPDRFRLDRALTVNPKVLEPVKPEPKNQPLPVTLKILAQPPYRVSSPVEFRVVGLEGRQGLEYRYRFGDESDQSAYTPSGSNVIQHTYRQARQFTVRVIAVAPGAASSPAVLARAPAPAVLGQGETAIDVKSMRVDVRIQAVGPRPFLRAQPVRFELEVTPQQPDLVYAFDFGDGEGTKTAKKSMDHVYGRAGSYTVRVSVVDRSGKGEPVGEAATTVTITDPAQETVGVTLNAQPGVAPLGSAVVFRASVTNAGGRRMEYLFVFGDGQGSGWIPEASISHTFAEARTYRAWVEVRAQDAGLAAARSFKPVKSNEVTVTVKPAEAQPPPTRPVAPPVAVVRLNAQPNPAREDERVTLAAVVKNGRVQDPEYLFVFGDGQDSGWMRSSSVSHIYAQARTYTARVEVRGRGISGAAGDAVTIRVVEKRDRPPQPVQVLVRPLVGPPYRAGQVIPFSAVAAPARPGLQYEVYFGDQSSGVRSGDGRVDHTYRSAGEYEVTAIVREGSPEVGRGSTRVRVEPERLPTVMLKAEPARVGTGGNVRFVVSVTPPVPGARYYFALGDGSRREWAGTYWADHRYRAPGHYPAVAYVSLPGLEKALSSDRVDVEVVAPGATIPPGPEPAGGRGVTPDITASGPKDVVAPRPDTVNVTLAADRSSVPPEEIVRFTAFIEPHDRTASYRFVFGDGEETDLAALPEAAHVYRAQGRYRAVVEVRREDVLLGEASLEITVGSLPQFRVFARAEDNAPRTGRPVRFLGGVVPVISDASYRWDFGDGQQSDWLQEPGVEHVYNREGRYSATLTARTDRLELTSESVPVVVEAAGFPGALVVAVAGGLVLLFAGGGYALLRQRRARVALSDEGAGMRPTIDVRPHPDGGDQQIGLRREAGPGLEVRLRARKDAGTQHIEVDQISEKERGGT